jgi:hypothetical protein
VGENNITSSGAGSCGVKLLALAGAPLQQSSQCPCGPKYCKDPIATTHAREAKKATMRAQGVPERLLKLLDKFECVGCIETAPSSFGIMIEYAPGNRPTDGRNTWTHQTYRWTPQEEALARKELRDGKITAFYILIDSQGCKCCGDKDPSERPDWNSTLEINTDGMLVFNRPGDLGPDPPELQAVPSDRLEEVPPIGTYTKPPKRQAHALCPACEAAANSFNSLADQIDYYWDLKVRLQRGIDITNHAIAERENQIAALEYQQILNPQPAVQQQIEQLNKINTGQSEDLGSDNRKLEDVNRFIKSTEAQQAAAMAKLLECQQKNCVPTTNATPTPAPASVTPCAPSANNPCTPTPPTTLCQSGTGCTTGACSSGQTCASGTPQATQPNAPQGQPGNTAPIRQGGNHTPGREGSIRWGMC